MTAQDRFEAEVRERLQARAVREAPAGLLARGMAKVRHTPQRRTWVARLQPTWMLPTVAAASVVVLLVAVAVLAGVFPPKPTPVGPAPSGSSAPSGAGSPAATPESTAPPTWPTVARSAATVPTTPDLAHEAFWTLWTPITMTDSTLRLGTLDGTVTRSISLPRTTLGPLGMPMTPQPAGPAGGLVVYVTDDGQWATLHAVNALTGTERQPMQTTDLIAQLALDPSGQTAYFLEADRQTGQPSGVFSIATDGGEPRLLINPDRLGSVTASSRYLPHLVVSADGGWVVLLSCPTTSCELYAVRPDGAAPPLHLTDFFFDGSLTGITGDLLIGGNTCGEAECDGFVVDLRTGDHWPLGGQDAPFAPKQLISGPHGPLVLGEGVVYEAGTWTVTAIDLTDRSRTSEFSATFKPAYTDVGLAEQQFAGAELPAGWFLMYRGIGGAPTPPPDFSAAMLGGNVELPLPVMTLPSN